MIDPDLATKIRNLLNLSRCPTGNPGEKSNAADLAAKLMKKHSITEDQLRAEDPAALMIKDFHWGPEPAILTWMTMLVGGIAEHNGCFCVRNKEGTHVALSGRPEHIATVEYLYKMCKAEALKSSFQMGFGMFCGTNQSRTSISSREDQFLKGFAAGVATKISMENQAEARRKRQGKQEGKKDSRDIGEDNESLVSDAASQATGQAIAVHSVSESDRARDRIEEEIGGKAEQFDAQVDVESYFFQLGGHMGLRVDVRSKKPALNRGLDALEDMIRGNRDTVVNNAREGARNMRGWSA